MSLFDVIFLFFSTGKVVQCFNMLPADAVRSSALEVYQTELDKAMAELFCVGESPFSSRRLGVVTSRDPFQPVCDSVVRCCNALVLYSRSYFSSQ